MRSILILFLILIINNVFITDTSIIVILTTIALIVSYLFGIKKYQRGFISLKLIFAISFLYNIGGEAILSRSDLFHSYGEYFITAVNFMCSSAISTFIGIDLYLHLKGKTKKELPGKISLNSFYINKLFTEKTSLVFAGLVILGLFPTFLSIALYGRYSFFETREYGDRFLLQIIQPIGYLTSSILAFKLFTLELKTGKKNLYIFLLIFINALFFASGSRYFLLFSLAPIIFLYILKKGRAVLRVKTLIILVICLTLPSLMVQFRSTGISVSDNTQNSESSFLGNFSREGLFEGNVFQFSRIVQHYDNKENEHGERLIPIIFFYIPRTVWPDKPTLLGYDFVHTTNTDFTDEYNSVTASFAAESFVDWGYTGGIIFNLIIGFFIGFLDFLVMRTPFSSVELIFLIFAYPYIFFYVRSFDTSFINLVGIYVYYKLFLFTLKLK